MNSFTRSLTSGFVVFFGIALPIVSALSSSLGAQEQAAQPRHGAALEMMTQMQNVFADVAESVFPSVVIVTWGSNDNGPGEKYCETAARRLESRSEAPKEKR